MADATVSVPETSWTKDSAFAAIGTDQPTVHGFDAWKSSDSSDNTIDSEFTAQPIDTAILALKSIDADPMIGQRLGHFLIESVIASGGMGTVYRARQLEPVRRTVALKMIRRGFADATTIRRFHAERQALALMEHPDIAQVHEADTTADGNPYFAMEFCSGKPIDQYCDQHALPIDERVKLVIRIGHAVQQAHVRGVIHRDLKPNNVLVSECEGGVALKIIDFGIAKFTDDQWASVDGGATRYGELIGTPAYMSPEQAGNGTIDGRVDVFAIGAILFQLLTGTVPIEKQAAQTGSLLQVIEQIQNFQPVTPSSRLAEMPSDRLTEIAARRGHSKVGSFVSMVRGDLDWITLRAIASDRMLRYATPQDFAEDLQRFLNNQPVVAAKPTAAYRLRKLYHRHRLFVLALAIVLATMSCALSIAGFSYVSVKREQAIERAHAADEIALLVDDAADARRCAVMNLASADREFASAGASLDHAEKLLGSHPRLNDLSIRLAHSRRRLQADREAIHLIKTLNDARQRTTQINPAANGSSFGRAAGLQLVISALGDFGITPLVTDVREAARRLDQFPEHVMPDLIATFDFLMHQPEDEIVRIRMYDAASWPIEHDMTSGGDIGHWAMNLLSLIDPDPWRMKLRAAVLLHDLNELKLLSKGVPIGQPPISLIHLAAALYHLEQSNEAVDLLRLAQQRHPSDYWANHYLGTSLAVAHDPPLPEPSLRYLVAAVALAPHSLGARTNLIEGFLRVGDVDSAIKHLESAVQLAPDQTHLQQKLSVLKTDRE